MEDLDQAARNLIRFFGKIFRDPRYAFLNPEARGGRGGKGKRGGGSPQLSFVKRPRNPRAGWLDPRTNKVVMNLEHPLFVKYENNVSARNQRMTLILASVLIKNASAKKPMDAAEALALQNDLLTMSGDYMW